MDNIKKLLGKRIKEIRVCRGLKQETLAEMAGIEPPTLSNIENGKNYPTGDTLEKIAVALDVLVYELFLFEHIKIPPVEYIVKELSQAMLKNEQLARHLYVAYQNIKKF